MDQRLQLIRKIGAQKVPEARGVLPVVRLEDFFDGNSDCGSIGCNLTDHPGPQAFFDVLRKVRDDVTVQDVLIEINEVVDDPHTWPFSDRVYILSSAAIEDIQAWLRPLRPDEVTEGWAYEKPPAAPAPNPGVKVYAAWWD